jgi:hypothetical protein
MPDQEPAAVTPHPYDECDEMHIDVDWVGPHCIVCQQPEDHPNHRVDVSGKVAA